MQLISRNDHLEKELAENKQQAEMTGQELKKVKIDKDDYEHICQSLNDKLNKIQYETKDDRSRVANLKSQLSQKEDLVLAQDAELVKIDQHN